MKIYQRLWKMRSIKAVIILFVAIFICFIWMGLYFIAQEERQQEIVSAFKETANYARMFEEHTERTIKGLDQVALFLKYQVEKEGMQIDLQRFVNEGRFSGQPFVALAVLDKKGELIASCQEGAVRVNNGDMDAFQTHKTEDSGKIFIGAPLLGRVSGKWLIQMSRRINLPDGSFGGVVVVGVDPFYFAQFYKQVDLGEESGIALVGRDGIVRVHQTGNEVSLGNDVRERVNKIFSRGVAGNFAEKGIADGVNRFFGYRNLEAYPLTVVVGASEAHVFRELDRRVAAYYWAGAALSGLIVLFALLLLRSIRRREQAELELRQSEERFRAYFQENQSVMLLVDKEKFRVIDANPAAADYYGYPLAQLKQMAISEINILPIDEITERMERALLRLENIFLFSHRLASGEIRQVEVYSTPIRVREQQHLLSIIHDVTERVKLEAKVREREANFFGFFNTIDDLLFVLDAQGIILHVNQTVLNRLEYREEELTGKSVLIAHSEQQRLEAERIVKEMLAGTADFCPISLMSKSGKLIPVETRIFAGTWNGKPALFGVSKDLSALKISEEKLAKVFEATSSLMAVSTLKEGIYLDVNQAYLSTLGFDRAEVIGKRSVELQIFEHPEVRDKMAQKVEQEGSVHLQEVQLRTKGGRALFGLFSAEIVEVASQRLLITTVNDVTQLKLAEQRLREREEELFVSEQRMQQIIEGTKMGTWEWNIQTGETVFNQRWAEMVGYTLDELKPTTIMTWQSFAHPDDLIESGKMLQEHFEGRSPNYAYDSRMRHKDGHWIWVFDSGKVMKRDGEGNPLLMSGTHLDITERKQAEAALQASEQRYRALVHQAYEAVLVIDLETLEVTEANAAFETLTGYRFSMEKPLHLFDLMADEPVNIMRYIDEVHASGVLHSELRRVRTCDGRICLVERTCNRVKFGDRQYLIGTLRDVTQERLKQQQMHRDLVLAAQVQQALLPVVPRSPQFRISIVFEPERHVSGDVYFLEWQEVDQVLRGFLVDITGHGLATALQTAAVNVLLHQLLDLPGEVSLPSRLSWLNKVIPPYIDENTFAAAIGFEIDFRVMELCYASAGINHFLINGEKIDVAGLFLGIREDETYELHRRSIRQGDAVCFMTDGISDIFDRENRWGTVEARRLCRLFHEEDWTEKTQDDATAICIEVRSQKEVSHRVTK